MKKIAFVLLSALILSSPSFAQERAVLETITPAESRGADNPFIFSMAGEGTLKVKAGSVFTQGGDYTGIALPYLLSSPEPIAYPRWAVRRGWQGRLEIAVEILTDGSVGRYQVMKSTGYDLLDKAATDAVRTWKFHPAMKNGQPIAECIQIPVVFQLEE